MGLARRRFSIKTIDLQGADPLCTGDCQRLLMPRIDPCPDMPPLNALRSRLWAPTCFLLGFFL